MWIDPRVCSSDVSSARQQLLPDVCHPLLLVLLLCAAASDISPTCTPSSQPAARPHFVEMNSTFGTARTVLDADYS
jgi:hypothetical protein